MARLEIALVTCLGDVDKLPVLGEQVALGLID